MYEMLREHFPPNRLVALLTPAVATFAGLFAAWLSDHAPFVAEHMSEGEVTAVFISVLVTVLAMAYKWLDGWQNYEARNGVAALPPSGEEYPEAVYELSEEEQAHPEAEEPDDDYLLSQSPGDIDPSDARGPEEKKG